MALVLHFHPLEIDCLGATLGNTRILSNIVLKCITTTRHGKSWNKFVSVLIGCVGFGCVGYGCVGYGCVGFGCVKIGFFEINQSRKVLPIRNAARQEFVFLENVRVKWRNSSAFKPRHNILMRYGKW